MDKETVINKLELQIREFGMTVTEALNMAYGAGYDAREKDYNQSQEKKVIMENSQHKKLRDFDSMAEARRVVGMSKSGMIDAIKKKHLTRKGYYFRYEEDEDTGRSTLDERGHGE